MAIITSPPNPNVATLTTLGGDPVVEEARRRMDRCIEWESTYRKKFLEDIKFANADSYNGYQWPDDVRHTRDLSDRPCLTMNVTQQHNLQITNAARRNKQSAKILGMGNGATQESANVVKAIIKHIEYVSNAQFAYGLSRSFQVEGGIGWWRILTDYESNDTFDQEIYIAPITDPLSVYMDPDIQTLDGSDAKFAFLFDFLDDDRIRELVPDWASDGPPKTPLGLASGESFWIEKDHTMVCEYFRKVPDHDVLISYLGTGFQRMEIRGSKLPAEARRDLIAASGSQTRKIVDWKVEWKLIVGEQIVDELDWPGCYIPLIRCIGKEYVIEGILDRKGHTRALQDAQRMYNYNGSAQVEYGALQSKTPYIAPAKAIEEHESMWNTANTENHSVLVWNHVDEDNPDVNIPPPIRLPAPAPSQLYAEGMETAFNQMMMVSGQWQNQMGMMGNERTGAAINSRQDQGDNATYHFQDNYGEALRYTYKQIIDLIPKIYDTRRVKHILADDGVEMEVVLDPRARQSYLLQQARTDSTIQRVLFNPQLGKYDVAADVGPATTTRMQESADALTLILTQAPGLTGIIGDLLLKCLDFDEAQEAAQRLKRMVPPQALGQGPSPQEQAMQTQIGQLTTTLATAMQRHGKDALKLVGKDQMRDIDVYKAETDRIKAMATLLPTDQGGLQQLIEQLVGDAIKTHLTPIIEQNMDETQDSSGAPSPDSAPPFPGAQQAPDGQWYLLDPTRRGRYLKVAPLAQQRKIPNAA